MPAFAARILRSFEANASLRSCVYLLRCLNVRTTSTQRFFANFYRHVLPSQETTPCFPNRSCCSSCSAHLSFSEVGYYVSALARHSGKRLPEQDGAPDGSSSRMK